MGTEIATMMTSLIRDASLKYQPHLKRPKCFMTCLGACCEDVLNLVLDLLLQPMQIRLFLSSFPTQHLHSSSALQASTNPDPLFSHFTICLISFQRSFSNPHPPIPPSIIPLRTTGLCTLQPQATHPLPTNRPHPQAPRSAEPAFK